MVSAGIAYPGQRARRQKRPRAAYPDNINVAMDERLVSVVIGAGLALFGLARRSLRGAALAALGGGLIRRGVTGHCPLYARLGIDRAAAPGSLRQIPQGRGFQVEKTVTIDRSPQALYDFWRNFENLPLFTRHLRSVRAIDPQRSHWVARAPLGSEIEWDAEIIKQVPGEMIAWQSVQGSQVSTAGSVWFKPAAGGLGTEVRINLRYDPPGGALGAAFAKLFHEDPATQVEDDLRRLKQVLEYGRAAAR